MNVRFGPIVGVHVRSISKIKRPAIAGLFIKRKTYFLSNLSKKVFGFIYPAFIFWAVFASICLRAFFKLA